MAQLGTAEGLASVAFDSAVAVAAHGQVRGTLLGVPGSILFWVSAHTAEVTTYTAFRLANIVDASRKRGGASLCLRPRQPFVLRKGSCPDMNLHQTAVDILQRGWRFQCQIRSYFA